ncbi:YihY/virulence factor BrkB family protein [Streptomyces smyrnaeus]|uniref:YihY/virulence factor BrkB family protein n=1 Tax=Streptomyces smyrnaeus TaxID=1387713 RepID=A0ABS3Y4U4_9ACTN|nr:YihY/virulence factor BrkB family protein [Streptomyces smyrnaeus]MBO8202523.1 YihY/virulence factor BrkB family protein [Streptomyces smyrnaeus]
MERLRKLPLVGPLVARSRTVLARLRTTRIWRIYEHLDDRKWTRLAAAITFTSFLALFPMLAVGAAVAAALLSHDQMDRLQDTLTEQVPGISDQLELQSLVDNAGTVGGIAGGLLLLTGGRWVGTLRESLRAVWDLEEDPGNLVVRRAVDVGILLGLGVVGLVSFGGSAFAVTAVTWVAEQLGSAEGGVGTVLLRTAAYTAAVAADFVLLWYVLTLLPRVRPPRRATLAAALQGAVGFELLKLLLGGYLQQVAAKNVYGAFGVPIALLLWISFMTKLLLYCAAWTATAPVPGEGPEAQQPVQDLALGGDDKESTDDGEDATDADGSGDDADVTGDGDGPAPEEASDGAPRTPPEPGRPEHRP